ncbi:MAG: site-specific integrase, partial [Clostridia bacterium]|nr:site-specific integrase [Clostridia bacterium]
AALLDSEDTTSLGILFALFTGVRIGELCGLRWEDIDLRSSTPCVRRTVERIADLDPLSPAKTKVIISEPKTESSVRTIPLPSFLAEYLRRVQMAGEVYLVSGNTETPEPHCFYVRYKNFLKKHGIGDYTFHALRHTFATQCVEYGFDTKSLAEILGHSSVTTTMAFYVHPTMEQKRAQMELLAPPTKLN